jgi:hypothetical protein
MRNDSEGEGVGSGTTSRSRRPFGCYVVLDFKVMRAVLDYKTLLKPRDDMSPRNIEETNRED